MPPLTRQQTSGSVRSWWSNRNPNLRGPTINLHAAAKPLMRLLYNRQALEFISTIDSIPLSAKDAEIYGSYLSCEYVSVSTKRTILEDLSRRAQSESEALKVHAHVFDDILQLLELPVTMDTRIPTAVWMIVRTLAKCEATAEATCSSLVAALCNSDMPQLKLIDGALSVLSEAAHIKFPPATSGASLGAKLLDRLSDMLKPLSTIERSLWILRIVSNLARDESTTVAIVDTNILHSVEKILRCCPIYLYEHIFPMLEHLASRESTAMAVVRVLPLDLLGTLWHVDDTAPVHVLARLWEHLVIAKLLDSPRKAIAEAACGSLVALVCDSNVPQVVDGALWVLSRAPYLTFPPVTSGVSVEAKQLDHIVDMFEAPNTATEWRYPVIFEILSHLSFHESGAAAIVEAKILNSVEKLLRSRPTDLYKHIFPMLKSLVSHKSTVMAVLPILPLDLLGASLRESVDATTLIDPLASRLEGLVTTNITTKLLSAPLNATAEATCVSLVALFCDSDVPQVVDGALWLLSRVPELKFPLVTAGVPVEAKLLDHIVNMLEALKNTAKWRYPAIFQILSNLARHEANAVAIVEANILNYVEKLLISHPTDQYEHIFRMLENLASHESTATTVLNMRLYNLLTTLWHEYRYNHPLSPTLPVIDLLACMARWQEGAAGMVTAQLLNNIRYGVKSLNASPIRVSTFKLMRALVGHESTVRAMVAIVPRKRIVGIVTLLSNRDYLVRKCAVETLQTLDATLERIDDNSRNQ
ncbi:hypothetical protein C8J57DRAFT_1718330 [Mycena rebaudengoi]|nr:hypothetical protein C8J57DRAFT_1718330 [Mycena rebaudengoi]